jgi:hypothetical protein
MKRIKLEKRIMDDFRKLQKMDCPDGGGSGGKYGCPCCRKFAILKEHKKFSRKRAKRKLRGNDKKELDEFKSV